MAARSSPCPWGRVSSSRIRYRSSRSIRRPLFNVRVDYQGDGVFETSMLIDGPSFESLPAGEGIVDCAIENLPLTPKTYGVTLFVRSEEGVVDLAPMRIFEESFRSRPTASTPTGLTDRIARSTCSTRSISSTSTTPGASSRPRTLPDQPHQVERGRIDSHENRNQTPPKDRCAGSRTQPAVLVPVPVPKRSSDFGFP